MGDVPAGDGWLGAGERDRLAELVVRAVPKRAEEWRLRRWAGKVAVLRWLGEAGMEPPRVEIANHPDGVPMALVDGAPAAVALSLSDRAGRAVALVGPPGAEVGCDVELVEPRSDAFIGDWFDDDEQALVRAAAGARDLAANLIWSAKESALKVLREGLRRPTRSVSVTIAPADLDHSEVADPAGGDGWHPWTGRLAEGGTVSGWWRVDGDVVVTVAVRPPGPPPRRLDSDPG